MKVEIWSDVVCPWCAIGKRRFEAALARFEHADEVEVVWRSFELDPGADPAAGSQPAGELVRHLADKYGVPEAQAQRMIDSMSENARQEGWEFRLDRARRGSSLPAHQLIHLAGERGVQDAVKERLLRAYLTDGEPIADSEALVRLVAQAGLDADEARAVLTEGRYVDAVREDEAQARALGISGVPFFVVDGRYGVSGAQPTELFLQALRTAWAEAHPLVTLGAPAQGSAGAGACADGSCAI